MRAQLACSPQAEPAPTRTRAARRVDVWPDASIAGRIGRSWDDSSGPLGRLMTPGPTVLTLRAPPNGLAALGTTSGLFPCLG